MQDVEQHERLVGAGAIVSVSGWQERCLSLSLATKSPPTSQWSDRTKRQVGTPSFAQVGNSEQGAATVPAAGGATGAGVSVAGTDGSAEGVTSGSRTNAVAGATSSGG